MNEPHALSKEQQTDISTEYLRDLLDKASPKPWEYRFISTEIYGSHRKMHEHAHQIFNSQALLMEQASESGSMDWDPDWELTALAPALAEEVIQLRGIIEDCEKSIAAANKAPAHPEYLETLEDYEDAPVGTIVERTGDVFAGRYLIKIDKVGYQSWYIPSVSGDYRDEDIAGTRRRVIYWPEEAK